MIAIVMFFLQGILELTGTVAFSLASARVPLLWGRIIAVGTSLTVIVYIVRSLQTTFGLHTVILLLLLAFFIRKTTYTTHVKSYMAAFLSIITLTLLELIIFKLYFLLTKSNPNEVISNVILWKLLGLPQGILLIIFAKLITKYKKPNKDAWRI